VNLEFYRLHSGLPREGPGEAADVLWALGLAGRPARVLDAGAGPGADSLTLAEALPEARIEAVEGVAHFVAEARARLGHLAPRVEVRMGDMFDLAGPYDLIFAAGCAYFLGITEALQTWRPALSPAGHIAFSEAVWLRPDPPPVLANFWSAYDAMTDIPGTRACIAAAGFRILGERVLSDTAWQAYYAPLEARIGALRKEGVSAELAEVLEDAEVEIAMRRQYPEYYGYCLFVVAPG